MKNLIIISAFALLYAGSSIGQEEILNRFKLKEDTIPNLFNFEESYLLKTGSGFKHLASLVIYKYSNSDSVRYDKSEYLYDRNGRQPFTANYIWDE